MNEDAKNGSDERLEREIRGDPENALLWNELFTRRHRRLFLKAMRTCNGNEEEAKDLVQEIFIAVWGQKSDIDHWKSLYNYIDGIAQKKCYQWIRREQRRKRRMVSPAGEGEDDRSLENLPSSEPDPGNQLAHEDAVSRALGQIRAHFKRKPKHWEIIKLAHIEKLSHAEIAVRLGIKSEGAARKQLHEAIAALAELCNQHNITVEELHEAIMRYYDEMS